MSDEGVWMETLESPTRYSRQQIELAAAVMSVVNRGRFVLCEAPSGIALADEPEEWNG
jgi:Rad3-related DNA helicase